MTTLSVLYLPTSQCKKDTQPLHPWEEKLRKLGKPSPALPVSPKRGGNSPVVSPRAVKPKTSSYPHFEAFLASCPMDSFSQLRITTDLYRYQGLLAAASFVTDATKKPLVGIGIMLLAAGWQGDFLKKEIAQSAEIAFRQQAQLRSTREAAAIRLQCWKRFLRTHHNVVERRLLWAVNTLQRWARGTAARRWTAPMAKERARLVAIMLYDTLLRGAPLRAVAYNHRPNFAAIRIQMLYRSYRSKKILDCKKNMKSAILIQRIYRGHRGRKYALEKRQRRERQGIENAAALQVQRMYRGHSVRVTIRQNKESLMNNCLQQRIERDRIRRKERVDNQQGEIARQVLVQRDVLERRMVLDTILRATMFQGRAVDVNEHVLQTFSAKRDVKVQPQTHQEMVSSIDSLMSFAHLPNGSSDTEVLSWNTNTEYRPPAELQPGPQMQLRVTMGEKTTMSRRSSPGMLLPPIVGGAHSSPFRVPRARTLKDVKARAEALAMKRVVAKPKAMAYY